jgi:hypothetical protein
VAKSRRWRRSLNPARCSTKPLSSSSFKTRFETLFRDASGSPGARRWSGPGDG